MSSCCRQGCRAVFASAITAALLVATACGNEPLPPPPEKLYFDSSIAVDSAVQGIRPECLPYASITVNMTLKEDDPIFDDDYSGQGSAVCLGTDNKSVMIYTNMHCTGLTELLHDGDPGLLGDEELDLSAFYMEVEFPSGSVVRVDSFALFHPYDLALLMVNARYLEEGRDFVILPLLPDEICPPPAHPVIAVGTPFGLQGSVTAGVVSAYRRFDVSDDGYGSGPHIQFDAAVSPGSSGGPLLVQNGDGYFLLGMTVNSAGGGFFSPAFGCQNINFALDLRKIFAGITDPPEFYSADLDGAISVMNEVFGVAAVEAGR